MMKQDEVLRAILAEWRRRSESERQTESQLATFAMAMADNPNYRFRCSGDRYQHIMAYMSRHVSGLRKHGS